jgi:ABC-type antimicrobial peptide transport system permease subunit
MIKNFLIVSYRNLVRNASYTFINALGLSIGIAACIIIFLVVHFETSFDKFHTKYDRIYRITTKSENASGIDYSATTPYPFGSAFHTDFADVPLNTHIHFQNETQLSYGSEKTKIENVLFADSLFFRVFDFGILSGNPAIELGQPGKAFLTESLVAKLGGITPKTIKLDNKLELEVVGTLQDPPANSHISYTMVVSMPSLTKEFVGLPLDSWGMRISGTSYVVLPERTAPDKIEDRLVGFVEKYHPKDNTKQTYLLQPLSDIHFNTNFATNLNEDASLSVTSLWVLVVLGLFILAVACVNFINLSTALAVKKSREIGVRKTLGANRGQLTRQYLMESLLVTLLSTLIALVLVELSIAPIRSFLENDIQFSLLGNPTLAIFLIGLVLVTAFLSGLYPALILSRFNPAVVLKNKLNAQGSSGGFARKYLVVFQFLIAQLLIIGTLVVADQMDYFHSKPLGFVKNAIVNIQLPERTFEKRSALTAELSSIHGIEKTSFSSGAPTSEVSVSTGFYLTERGEEERYDTNVKCVDQNYIDTYGLELVAGRWFLPSEERFSYDSLPEAQQVHYYVVNEALVRKLGFSSNEEILGKYITTGLNDINAPVVGVIKDFHTTSLHRAVEPVAMVQFPYFFLEAGIRFNQQTTSQTLAAVESAFKKVFPDHLYEYTFLDEHVASLYKQEEKTYSLIRAFAGLSIFISCLGLLGLISFLTQQKIKEVGIRKVFGASVGQIVFLFSTSFVKLVAISFLVATPAGWYIMNKWLDGFAYRAPIHLSVFAVAIISTLLIALLTVSFQAVRAALANPVNSLRSE